MSNFPVPDLTGGGRGVTYPWLLRYTEPLLRTYSWTNQSVWRQVVQAQPVALLCREKIVDTLSSMEWRIEPKDPSERQELRLKIRHYTDLFLYNKEQDKDYVDLVTHVLEDALDLPFGCGVELIREGDKPSGKVVDYVLLDGATLYPTNNRQFPVVQRVNGLADYVIFPRHAINRLNYSMRREIEWNGWAFPPPQKIYMAINMISKGDDYYWKLLIDTPEAGLLDLIDMDKDSAEKWIEAFRDLMTGVDPYKVPVLYEHEKPAQYLSFTRPPQEIMFDKAISRYDSLTAGGYGLSLSSIGLSSASNGGETLAGSIRQERNDRTRGIGLAKRKFKFFIDRMLPNQLEFQFVDPDDEQQVARGRAKLSISTAHNNWINNHVLSPKEARADLINTGLLTVTIPEDLPEEDKKLFDEITESKNQSRENMLTATQPPSAGGQGEIRASKIERAFSGLVEEYLSYGEDGSFALDTADFVEFVLEETAVIFEQQKQALPVWSLKRYKSLSHDKKELAWRGVRAFLINLRADFPAYCQRTLDNKEDLSDNIRELLMQNLIQDFTDVVGKSIKKSLEI